MTTTTRLAWPTMDGHRTDLITRQGEAVVLEVCPERRRVWTGVERVGPGEGTPERRWHGRTLTMVLSAEAGDRHVAATPALVEHLVAALDGPLADLCDACETVWDGHNHVGRWPAGTDEVVEAWVGEDGVCSWCPGLGDMAGYWDIADWLDSTDIADLGLSADSTEADIREVAERIEADAMANDVLLDGDVVEYLAEAVARMRDERDDGSEGGAE